MPADVTVLQQPVQNIYLVSTSAMDLFLHLDALDSIALSGTRAEGWYLDEAKQAMQSGRIAYAGKYSAPDYERILTAECGLAVENTMIYHTPEVKEQLERFGIPVLVERSSYESSPLARMEWIKLYGILLGKEALAEEVFARQAQRIAPLLEQPSTGKRCAFFSITSSGLATVRKSGDYVAQMIGMAGGEYVFADLADSGNSLSTMNIPLEDLYAGVKDADVLIYNGTIEGTISTKEELLARCALLAECKAVQSGDIWCTTPSFFACFSMHSSSSSRSTDSMRSTTPTRYLTLLVCRWPMKCRGFPVYAPSGRLAWISCTRFSPQQSTPAATASFTRSASFIFVAAHSRISDGSRPAFFAASAIWARIFAIFSAIVDISVDDLSIV